MLAALAIALAAAKAASDADRCALPEGWQVATIGDPRYIVFGEDHGTVEGPTEFGTIACALSGTGARLLVAVELSAPQNDALQAAWALPRGRFADALTQTMPDWRERNDGVTSEAMLALLVRLHALKTAGRVIDVVAFNGERDEAQRKRFADLPAQGPHEAAQAENIRIAEQKREYDRVLVLVGVVHALKRPVPMAGTTFEPMAMRLTDEQQVLGLNLIYGRGTGWSCELREGAIVQPGKPIGEADISCGVHPQRGREGFGGGPRIGLWPNDWQKYDDLAWDGYFWVGPAHASPPALAEAGKPQ